MKQGLNDLATWKLVLIIMVTFVGLLQLGLTLPAAIQFLELINGVEEWSFSDVGPVFRLTIILAFIGLMALPLYIFYAAAIRTLVDRVRYGSVQGKQ